MKDYAINVFWTDEDGCTPPGIADIPDLVACSATGPPPQEALAAVLEARETWLESARGHGDPVPVPAYRPEPRRAAG